eukprot:4045725-Amphidinium_carterae.1
MSFGSAGLLCPSAARYLCQPSCTTQTPSNFKYHIFVCAASAFRSLCRPKCNAAHEASMLAPARQVSWYKFSP